MPIPTNIRDLSSSEESNYPAGSDPIGGTLDNYLRAHAAIIKQQCVKGVDLAALAGSIAIPDTGAVFDVINAGNVTEFTGGYDGRTAMLRFVAGVTLKQSGSLILPNALDMTVPAGAVLIFYRASAAQWVYAGTSDALRLQQVMKGADIPSAAAIAFPIEGSLFDVTGTTTITAIAGSFPGRMTVVRFADTLTLTNGTNLILPGAANITTQAGDFAAFVCLDGAKWQCWLYPRLQNDATEKASSDHFGPDEPSETWPGMTWADSGTNTLWRRNAADDDWVYEHRILDDATADLQWLGKPIGEEFPLHPDAPLPPTDNPNFRYVVLTAGLTGAGKYNEGILSGETVTGSDPTITATAVVSLVGSPMDGQTIDLINTSRTFLRPGPAAGPIVNSQNLLHSHTVRAASLVAYDAQTGGGNPRVADLATDTGASGGDEAHPRYIPRVYYMRIK